MGRGALGGVVSPRGGSKANGGRRGWWAREQASKRRSAEMAHSMDLGIAMRNGHTKAMPAAEKEKASPKARRRSGAEASPKKGRASKASKQQAPPGVHVERRFTAPGTDPLDAVVYERRTSTITNPDGSIVFKMEGAEVPTGWSQLATDILISKYFRKAGLHGDKDKGETSVRQVVHRLAHTVRGAADNFGGYLATKTDA